MNAQKNKGDAGEREAVEVLKGLAPDLVLPNAMRMLGAGRKDDIGDLAVFSDVTIQVKVRDGIVDALNRAARGGQVEHERAGTDWWIGMAPIPRARRNAIRWICVTTEWPATLDAQVPTFSSSGRAIDYFRDSSDELVTACHDRVAKIVRRGLPLLYVSPVSAWVDAYRAARNSKYAA